MFFFIIIHFSAFDSCGRNNFITAILFIITTPATLYYIINTTTIHFRFSLFTIRKP